jgi:hypothetical protein
VRRPFAAGYCLIPPAELARPNGARSRRALPFFQYGTKPGDPYGKIHPFFLARRRWTGDHSLAAGGAQRQWLPGTLNAGPSTLPGDWSEARERLLQLEGRGTRPRGGKNPGSCGLTVPSGAWSGAMCRSFLALQPAWSRCRARCQPSECVILCAYDELLISSRSLHA